ncbi:hypothetical protein FMUND_5627 [Fusarium mundagurra]|uniref:Transcription factor domain-containing protein n=1 Tax=Fusarium mundagurra TaxID=1567541 RepID=A0A8H5YUM6_9HYPO|nr:hypothetical protein FMUND_5627 [Fusarium mundagurra]
MSQPQDNVQPRPPVLFAMRRVMQRVASLVNTTDSRNPACCKYEICGSSETRTSTHIIRVTGSTTSYERLYPDDSEPPTSTRPLSELGPCGWDLTEHGQAELMQAVFAYRYRTYPEQVAEETLKKTVDILLRERGCDLDTLLQDEVFESFPLVQDGCMGEYAYEDRGLARPGLILAILLVRTLPCNHLACLKRKRLYVTILAMLPILQSELGRSNGVIRIQALVAVYEYGQGSYYQSHLNLNSAICMASRIELPQSIGLELALELRLSLMLLDCMLALSTHHRDEGDPRPGETIQSALSIHQSVSIAGYVLQHIHDSKRSPRSSRHECDAVYAQTLRMVEVALNDRTTDMHHSVLVSSCLLVHHAHISTTCQPWKLLEPDQWLAFHSSRESTWRLLKNVLCSYSDDEQDELHLESLISLMPSMNSMCIIANDPEDVLTAEEIAAVMPYIRNPAACAYRHPTEPLTSAVGTDNSQPSPTDCFLYLGRCGWDLTESGQAQLMKAMLAYDSNDPIAKAGLGENVRGVFRDRGCTLQELLKDPVFEALPVVEHLRTTGSLHRSELVDSSWPILHLAILLVATPPCDHKACSQTKRLYVAVKALVALMQLHLPNHAELVQTQGLIALYECGHGMLEHAHVTLNSAFTMAARLDVDLSSVLTSLEWRLSLMLIDILVALQTLHRKQNWIPLACPPDHDMVRAIKHNFTVLRTPNGTPRPEIASQRVLELGTVVFQCGHILQHVHDSKRDPRTANPHCELMVEIENSIPPFGEDTKHLERALIRQCRARAAVDAELSFTTNSGDDKDQEEFSLAGLIVMMKGLRP